jgi:hypothetical protein
VYIWTLQNTQGSSMIFQRELKMNKIKQKMSSAVKEFNKNNSHETMQLVLDNICEKIEFMIKNVCTN